MVTIRWLREQIRQGKTIYDLPLRVTFYARVSTEKVEQQIRTNGMDFWATLEHQLRYKKGIEDLPGYEEISKELLLSAQAVIETDNEMQRIKNKFGKVTS